ncbi:hypothetical protein ALC53_01622 [Atta colombica]|uniref:Uncharacterized protein n=1 Tax=Atta colombica TaxID=520822 RepID=A0A195BV51_9HYME|nr:hypothetical protein ALC53_01622 [Atta colombica]
MVWDKLTGIEFTLATVNPSGAQFLGHGEADLAINVFRANKRKAAWINETERRRHRHPVAKRTPMKMLQSLNALAGKISPGSPTDSNANKVHMHNNNNNNNNVHHHPYSKQQTQPSPSHSANGDQKENT